MLRRTVLAAIAALTAAPAWAAEPVADWSPLIEPARLAALLKAEPALAVLDIRAPADVRDEKGELVATGYASGHIPGAANAPYAAFRGPKENPGALVSDAALTETLRAAGVDAGEAVVIAHEGRDQTDFGAAARVYWTLKSAGVAQVAILNGGSRAWIDAGLPVSTEAAAPVRGDVVATLSDRWLATREDVRAAEDGEGAVLVDARPDAFFRGLKKHDAAQEAGTLFGAVNLVHAAWFPPETPVLSASDEALARARSLAEEADGADIISFCNTGHWAATNWFALSELAGVENVKLYPESVVGWTRAGLPLSPGS